jgi:hypothetical protein
MAAQVRQCQAHDCTNEVAGRKHKRTCSNSCRQALSRSTKTPSEAAAVAPTLPPAHESLVVAEIKAGRLTPESGLLWIVFPEYMRASASVLVAA